MVVDQAPSRFVSVGCASPPKGPEEESRRRPCLWGAGWIGGYGDLFCFEKGLLEDSVVLRARRAVLGGIIREIAGKQALPAGEPARTHRFVACSELRKKRLGIAPRGAHTPTGKPRAQEIAEHRTHRR
jgi:hypothetical protein